MSVISCYDLKADATILELKTIKSIEAGLIVKEIDVMKSFNLPYEYLDNLQIITLIALMDPI
jgi:hypothetical protein